MKERPPRQTPLILVIEDHLEWSEALQSLLAAEGYRTAAAHDGIEALSLIPMVEPDLIVLGLVLPVMDGLEFLKEYSTEGSQPRRRVPILALSSVPSYLLQAIDLGAAMALESPVGSQEFLEAVGALIHHRAGFRFVSSAARPRHRVASSSREVSAGFLEMVQRVFGVDAVTFGLLNEGLLEYRVGVGPRVEGCLRKTGDRIDSPCELVVASGQWLAIGDLDQSLLFVGSRWRIESGMRSYAGAPVFSPDGVLVGTVALHSSEPRVFGHSDKRLLSDFAELASTGGSTVPLPKEFLRKIMPALIARSMTVGEPVPLSVLGDETQAWSIIRDCESLGDLKLKGTGIAA